MSYLKVKEGEFIKKIGVNPIYKCQGKFYVGVETLCGTEEEIENCINCNTLEDAEQTCAELPQPINS